MEREIRGTKKEKGPLSGKERTGKVHRRQSFCDVPHHDEISDVHVVGDFNDWEVGQARMKRHKDGTWRLSVNLSPGTYEYKFWVDGKWERDPNCASTVPNPFGTLNSKVEITN